MNKIAIYAVAIVLLLSTLGYVYSQVKEIGYDECKLQQADAITSLKKEQADARAKHETELAVLRAEFARGRATADGKIKDLLAKNQELRNWWDTSVPLAADDFVFGGVQP